MRSIKFGTNAPHLWIDNDTRHDSQILLFSFWDPKPLQDLTIPRITRKLSNVILIKCSGAVSGFVLCIKYQRTLRVNIQEIRLAHCHVRLIDDF